MKELRFRQVHLDFHTSPLIPGIGAKFDRRQWQDALKKAHVDSITCFSSCHHGWSYHPTKVGKMHPGLDFNLLRAQMEGDGPYALSGQSAGSRRRLREAIELATPVEGIITDGFDLKKGNFGVKIAAAAADRIAAVDNGTVVQSSWSPDNGCTIVIQHARNLISIYKNLSQSLVAIGQTIRSGELIGYNAEAENGEVKLFEFELWNNGKPVDPEEYIVF